MPPSDGGEEGTTGPTSVNVSRKGHVAVVEIQRPPNNFFDIDLIEELASSFEALDADSEVRAVVLAAEGKHFCAGADFSNAAQVRQRTQRRLQDGHPLYRAALRMFACKKPVIGAIQGSAVGGGLGLALLPDFRIVTPSTRLWANFVRLGFHPGFGLTLTLPRLIGMQKASLMFLTGRRIDGRTALDWALADDCVPEQRLRATAIALAEEVAENAPLALISVRATLRNGLIEALREQVDKEFAEQHRLQQTDDHREGVRAAAERRPASFTGR